MLDVFSSEGLALFWFTERSQTIGQHSTTGQDVGPGPFRGARLACVVQAKCSARRLSAGLTAMHSYPLVNIKESVGGNILQDHGSSH